MNDVILQVNHLKKGYSGGATAVDDVSFTVAQGEILGIVGESGCGKSTLARCIIRLLRADEGEIIWRGEDIASLNEKRLGSVRPQIQMIFQNPYASFNPRFSVGGTLKRVGRFYKLSPTEYENRLSELLSSCEIDLALLERHPRELSGGQLQRLAAVRALLPGPKLLIADEAVSALDVSVQESILSLLLRLRDRYGIAVLFISHDLAVVRALCSRVLVMYRGSVVEEGETGDIFQNPVHPYTRALLSARPRLDPKPETKRILLSGDVHDAAGSTGCPFSGRCYIEKCRECETVKPRLESVSENHRAACHLRDKEKL